MANEFQKYVLYLQECAEIYKNIGTTSAKNPNINWAFVKAHPEINWNYGLLVDNPNITIDIISDNPDYNWNWSKISSRSDLTIKHVLKHNNQMWDWEIISARPDLTFDIINNNKLIPWHFGGFSSNPNITWNIICRNRSLPWDHRRLIINPVITWSFIKANPDMPWDHRLYQANPNIKLSVIANNPDIKWDYAALSVNVIISLNIFQKYPNIPWNYQALSQNKSLTWDIIQANPDKSWTYEYLSGNPNITWENITCMIDKLWLFSSIFKRLKLKIQDIIQFVNNPLIWGRIQLALPLLSDSHNITSYLDINNPDHKQIIYQTKCPISLKYIETHINEDWNMFYLSLNKNLTTSFIKKHSGKKWDLYNLCCNSLTNKKLNINEILKICDPNIWHIDWAALTDYEFNIPLDFIEKHINEDWNWDVLINKSNMTWEFIDRYPDIPWNYKYIESDSPLMTIERLKAFPDKFKDYRYCELCYLEGYECDCENCGDCDFEKCSELYFGPSLTYNQITYQKTITQIITKSQLIIKALQQTFIDYV